MPGKLDDLLDFVRFTHEVRSIKRKILFEDYERFENDEEHMYQLALTAWFLIENDKLKLDKFKCIGMALAHDITEVYSGDTPTHAPPEERAAHEKREKRASGQLKQQWPTLVSMHELVDEYLRRETPEAKFIYALDKTLPVFNLYLYEGRSWKQQNISLTAVKSVKAGKVDISPEVGKYFEGIMKLVEQRPELFGKAKK